LFLAQALLQDPQLLLSVFRSTQVFPQSVRPDLQICLKIYPPEVGDVVFETVVTTTYAVATHFPLEHLHPDGHTLVQLPQCDASVNVFTHTVAAKAEVVHIVCPSGQEEMHVPPLQDCPFMQEVPQEPQLDTSDKRSRQVPLHIIFPVGQVRVQMPL
jgi:hypothetical protein